jgi:E3 ubiquitin-protein ligase HUWE1
VEEAQKSFRYLVSFLGLIRLLSDMYCTHSLSHSKSLNAIVQTFSGELGAGLFIQFGRMQRACLIEKRYIKQAIPATWYEKPKKETAAAKAVDPALVVVGVGSQGGISTSTMEMDFLPAVFPGTTDEPPTSATQKEPAEVVSQSDPRVKNSQMIWHLVNEIPSVLAGLSKGLVKLLWSRRIAEASNRKAAQAITDEIAAVIYSHMAYERLCKFEFVLKATYI